MKNILVLLAVMLLSSCGGGSSNDSTTPIDNTGNSKPQISIASKTLSYVYNGTTAIKSTATISGSTNTTKITITGNISKNVGTYPLTYTATDLISNKQIRQTATITITPKPITITADAVSKLQGTVINPSLSDNRLTKLLSGDILIGILGSIGLSTSTAGSYDITSTLSHINYIITFVGEDKFSINSKPQIILASKTVSYVYATTAIKPTATITTNSTATVTGITISGNIGSDVGTYILTYNATDSLGNGAIPQIATIFITKKPITITADVKSKVQGTANPVFTYTTNGLISGDSLAGTLTSSGVNVGTHNIIIGSLKNDNYAITLVGENKFSITATATTPIDNTDNTKPQISIASKTLSYTYNGTTPTISTATITDNSTTTGIIITGNIGSDVGTYPLTYNTTDSAGNTAIPQIATVTITPKPVTITANVVTKVYGTANPSFGYVLTGGLVGGDSLAGSLSVNILNNADVGTYDITSTLSNNNYDITFDGANKFSITKASQPAFSAGNNQDKTFVSGATSGTTFTITTTGALSSNPTTYNTSNANIATIDVNGVITLKAAGTVTIGATSTADNNYNAAYDSFILTIYPTTTTLANVTATISGVQLAWSEVIGVSISYKVYYATKTIIGHNNLAVNYPNLAVSLIDNITNPATTVLNLKRNVVYHFAVTVVQNNVESVISNEVTSTLENPLNDTGLTFAGNSSGNNSTCVSSITSPQDCHQGRDAKAASGTLVKVGDGNAGFDFTKLDSNGDVLLASAASWSCVKDNVTGLIWEVKTTTSGIHNKDNTYKWGGIGADSFGTTRDDAWNTLVNGSNNNNLCGFNNWRVPNRKELRSIVDYSRANPSIDTNYFPNMPASSYFWSSSVYASLSSSAWGIGFGGGDDSTGNSGISLRVRLVRPGQ